MSGDRILLPTRRGFLASTGALALAGCSGNLIGPPPAPQLYVLHPDFTPLPTAPAVPWQLIVAVPVAPESFDTERIALTRAPNIMDYYANAQWTDRAPLLLQGLLVEAFEKSGKITAARESTGIRGDYILASEIHDFEAFYAVIDTPPKVQVRLSVSLLGALRHDVLATLQVQHEAQAAANDLPSVTAAFAEATGAAVEEIVNWTLHTPVPGADQAAPVSAPAAQPPPRRHRHRHSR
jgi:cholesterol transport system auxiliary component